MSHTPGPWWYDEKTVTIRGSLPAYWEDPNDKDADMAPIFALHGACSGEDIPANIRLAVAAPDLLEALQGLLNVVQRTPAAQDGFNLISISRAMDAIRTALGDDKAV